jgi:hypothetical protein
MKSGRYKDTTAKAKVTVFCYEKLIGVNQSIEHVDFGLHELLKQARDKRETSQFMYRSDYLKYVLSTLIHFSGFQRSGESALSVWMLV